MSSKYPRKDTHVVKALSPLSSFQAELHCFRYRAALFQAVTMVGPDREIDEIVLTAEEIECLRYSPAHVKCGGCEKYVNIN